MDAILQKKPKLNSSKLKENISLAEYTTFGVGGKADYFCVVESNQDLSCLLKWCKECGLPFLVIGNGSNLLVKEEGFKGLVIKLGEFSKYINCTDQKIIAGAGALLSTLWEKAGNCSLGGWEPLVGIPGTVGGAVVINAGTRYGKMEDIVCGVKIADYQGIRTLKKEEINFTYRESSLHSDKEVVVESEFCFYKKSKEKITEDVQKYTKERKIRQPLNLRSAGCIFKNPPEGPAAKFIDEAGLKGCSQGGAKVSELHANFIVNTGKATSQDIFYLIKKIQDEVYKKFSVSLEPEIKIV